MDARITEEDFSTSTSTSRFGRIVEDSINEIYIFDAKSLKFINVNRGARENLGYSIQELRDLTPLDLKPDLTPQTFRKLLKPLRDGSEDSIILETKHRRKNGSAYDVEVHLQFMKEESPPVFVAIILDITKRKENDHAISRANRALETTSNCNKALIKEASEDALLKKVCETIIRSGQYKMAWIGCLEEAHGKTLKMVSHAGMSKDCLASLKTALNENKLIHDPTFRAIRSGKMVIDHDIQFNRGNMFWCPRVKEKGYQSLAAIPLRAEGKIFGCINVYTEDQNAFDEVEVKLLKELANDLGYGIGNLRIRAEHERNLAVLNQSERQFRSIFESAAHGMAVASLEGRWLQVNQAFCDIVGYTEDELLSMDIWGLTHPDDLEKSKEHVGNLRNGNIQNYHLEKRYVHKKGYGVWVLVSVTAIHGENGEPLYFHGHVQDISDRKRAEKERKELIEAQQNALVQTIQAIALTLEKRDPYTAGHQRKVAELAAQMGEKLGLSHHQLEGLYMGGLIHDIGKIYIPSEILTRPGHISVEELNLIKTHPRVGYDIIKDVECPWPAAEIILQHHERIDGSGYPNGLKGEEIILEARILAVADVIEAMTSHRPYRPGLGLPTALKEVRMGRDKIYDKDAVDACLSLFKDKTFSKNFLSTTQADRRKNIQPMDSGPDREKMSSDNFIENPGLPQIFHTTTTRH